MTELEYHKRTTELLWILLEAIKSNDKESALKKMMLLKEDIN